MRRRGGEREGDAVKDATQINTAIPLVVKRESYADRLARWMESEAMRDFRTRLKNDPFTRRLLPHPDDPE